MKKSLLIVIIGVILILGFFAWKKNNAVTPTDMTASIKGCYVAGTDKDVYTLSIDTQTEAVVSGTLSFDNYQKDSSSGTVVGAYENGIFLADYSFQSEGVNSMMQVIFKRVGNDFVRGYGPMNVEGTKFASTDNITYDASSPLHLFKKTDCVAKDTTAHIFFPTGGEKLIAGKTYKLLWSGQNAPVDIFLVDTSLKSAGVSVSLSDRVYGVKSVGSYEYTIPKTMKPGVYEFQIGTATSKTFTIAS